MHVERYSVEAFELRDVPRLDPMLVLVWNNTSDRGQVIVECASEAWAAKFVDEMRGAPLRAYLARCTPEYLADRLHNPHSRRTTSHDRAYERRIAAAVIELFNLLEASGT